MPIWLLLALAGGGYFVYKELLEPKAPPPLLVTPQAHALHRRANDVYNQWSANAIDDDTLDKEMDKLGKLAVNFRDQNVISMSEGEVLRKQRNAIRAEAGLLM